MENTLFAYFENQLFPSPVQPQLRDSLQLFLYDCCIPNNGDTPFLSACRTAKTGYHSSG